jgi:hypothetical protein
LHKPQWLFNSFIKSNAADVRARLGLPPAQYRPVMLACGVSLDPDPRADQPAQEETLRRFLSTPEVASAAAARIAEVCRLVLTMRRRTISPNQAPGWSTSAGPAGWSPRP